MNEMPPYNLVRDTVFSRCRKYRFTLWRKFDSALLGKPLFDDGNVSKDGYVQFIGLNPSTADETVDDPTIRRCIGYCRSWGYSELCMTNIFPFRATDPKDMLAHDEPIEMAIENAKWIEMVAEKAAIIVCAWGANGSHKTRQNKVIKHLRDVRKFTLHHLGLNNDGSPKHPLYLKKTLTPIIYAP